MSFLMGFGLGSFASGAIVFWIFAGKAWSRGVEFGKIEAAETLRTKATALIKRVDDLHLLQVAREPVPESFMEKAQNEVLEWAETLTAELKRHGAP